MNAEQTKTLAPWPSYAADEITAVEEVLRSGRVNYWTGQQGREFEREYASYLGVPFALALANGSVALELALRALGIGSGDEVIVTPRSFIASASSIVLCGATPVFADVDADSQNITATTIAPMISARTRAIIVVHLAGWPCDMEPIMQLARQQGIRVIEDCAQAHGARYRGRPVGSFGDVAAFSFCQDKIISTGGEGGLLATSSQVVWERAWSFKDHGKNYAVVSDPAQRNDGAYRWVHDSVGSNMRMTEMQAAIGRLQLGKLDGWVATRRRNADLLYERLAGLPGLRIPRPGPDIDHAFYKFYAFLRTERLKPDWNRVRIIDAINDAGVPCFGGSCSEIYREKAFSDRALAPDERLPMAQTLGDTSLMFLVHPTLGDADMQWFAARIEDVMRKATT